MALDLFAGIPVSDYRRAITWYGQLLGAEPCFCPNDVEAVWEVVEHGYLYIEVRPEVAGSAKHTLFVPDLADRVTMLARQGLTAAATQTYDNGVRKVIYHDPDGNEIGLGGAPATTAGDGPSVHSNGDGSPAPTRTTSG